MSWSRDLGGGIENNLGNAAIVLAFMASSSAFECDQLSLSSFIVTNDDGNLYMEKALSKIM